MWMFKLDFWETFLICSSFGTVTLIGLRIAVQLHATSAVYFWDQLVALTPACQPTGTTDIPVEIC